MISEIRTYLAGPTQRLIVSIVCIVIIVALLFNIRHQLTGVDPRTVVQTPAAFDLACDACGHTWHAEAADLVAALGGVPPGRNTVLPCPQCGKKTGHLLESCPWCHQGLPRNAATRVCPHCGKDPDKWTADQ